MSAKRRNLVLILLLSIAGAIVGLYLWLREPEPAFSSGIVAVEGYMCMLGREHEFQIAANDKEDHDALEQFAQVLSRRVLDRHDGRFGLVIRGELVVVLGNKTSLLIICSSDDGILINRRKYLVDKEGLQSALDALLEASLAKLPEGDNIALNGNVVYLSGSLDPPLAKSKDELIHLDVEKDRVEIAEFERVLAAREPWRYRPDVVVADLRLSLRNGDLIFVEIYKGGQVILQDGSKDFAVGTYCSKVDPTQLAALYTLWLPKVKPIVRE